MPHESARGGVCNHGGGGDGIVHCDGEVRLAIDDDKYDAAVAAVEADVLVAVRHRHHQGSSASQNASTVAMSQQQAQMTTSTTKVLLQTAAQGNDNDENVGSPL